MSKCFIYGVFPRNRAKEDGGRAGRGGEGRTTKTISLVDLFCVILTFSVRANIIFLRHSLDMFFFFVASFFLFTLMHMGRPLSPSRCFLLALTSTHFTQNDKQNSATTHIFFSTLFILAIDKSRKAVSPSSFFVLFEKYLRRFVFSQCVVVASLFHFFSLLVLQHKQGNLVFFVAPASSFREHNSAFRFAFLLIK